MATMFLTPEKIRCFLVLFTAFGATVAMPATGMADNPPGPRATTWKSIEQALQEGKPKTAAELLAGVEQAATNDKAWAEAARAIATRVLADTGDRAPDEPERLIRLAAAIEKAPPETRGVLQAIRANWTWHFFLMNRWRLHSGRLALPRQAISLTLPRSILGICRRSCGRSARGSQRRSLARRPSKNSR